MAPRESHPMTSRTPASSRIFVTATPAAPRPTTRTLRSSRRLPVSLSAFSSAARTTIAVPCWSSWKTGMSSSSFRRCSIAKHRGALMSSRLMPPKPGATALTVATISSTSLVSSAIGKASTAANSLKSIALPSITGIAASGPMSPRPRTAVPSVTTATVLRLIVYWKARSGSSAIAVHTRATPGVYAIERSSRVLSGALLCSSILPPTCSRKVRSVVSTTRAAGTASIAATIASQCSGPLASTVMSRSVWWSSTLTRSTEPIVPPAWPIALATCPSMPGLWSISTRIVSEYWADGVAATPLTLLAPDPRRDGQSGGPEGVEHRRERRGLRRVRRGPVGGLAEQPPREQRAVLEQLVERRQDVGRAGRPALERRAQRRLAHELLDERSAHALRALDDRVALGVVERDVARIEVDEAPAARRVGQRDLQREVDAPGARGERGLDDVGTVGRQQEQQVGVLVDPLDLVEQVEQRPAVAEVHRALGRDEVDVLEDD